MKAGQSSLWTAVFRLPHRVAGALLREAMHPRVAAAAEQARRHGRYRRAERLYREALGLAERFGADDRWWATTYTGLAQAYSRLGNYIEAEALYRRALEIYQKAQHLEQPRMASCLSNLGALYYHQGKYAEAEALYQRALAIQESVLGPAHPEVAADLNNLSAICSQQRRYDEAESLLRRALSIQERSLGLDHPDVATTLNNLAFVYQDQGRSSEAESLLRRALAVMRAAWGPSHPDTALYYNNLALFCAEHGMDDAAEPLYRQALAIRRKALGPSHPDVATSLENYASMLSATMRTAEADRLFSQAKAIRARHAEELLTRRWSALPVSVDGAADEEPDWVARLSAAVAGAVNGPAWRVPSPRGSHAGDLPVEWMPSEGPAMPPASFLSAPEPAAELREEELRRALDRHELQIYYQPVLSLATGEITGAEALLRWQHPRRGLLSPRDFVPLAEETGLIFTMCERLLHDTCAQGAVWSQAGHPDIRLLLNLSQREFQDARLPRLVREVLRATRTDPASLQLEITERVVLQDVLSGIKALEALAATGIRVALDDAGTDRSLLRHLDRLPLHALKLDGTLVRRIAADPHAAALIAEITARAHSREMRVIALGVETEEQLALVREHQCDEVQGYLFHRAAPADRFAALLKEGWSVSADLFPVDLAETVGAPHVGRN